MQEYVFETAAHEKRLDSFLVREMPDFSRSYLQKLIAGGNVVLIDMSGKKEIIRKNGKDIRTGEKIIVSVPGPEPISVEAENIPLDILYEDDDLLIVNKPKGMVVHPAPGHPDGTLVNALLYHCQGNLSGINGVLRPGIVHRIDQNTTGSLIVCKTDQAHASLAAQLKVHSIHRVYRAIVIGNLKEDSGTIDAPIGRHPVDRKKMAVNRKNGRDAVTHYRVLERFKDYTYVELELETGRTHQIRVHMAEIGHPVLGDDVYGPSKCPFDLQGQTLHAMVIGFIHPTTGKYVEFTAPLPEYFEKLLETLRQRI